MPRATLTPITAASGAAPAIVTRTPLVVADGLQVRADQNEQMVFFVKNDTAGPATLTVRAGVYWMGGKGDATLTIPANSEQVVGPFESARFEQINEYLYLDSNVVVSVAAIQVA